MTPRRLRAAFQRISRLSLLGIIAGAAAPAVEIKEVVIKPMVTVEFKRISEYFTGKEATGHRVIVRSEPENRTGLYFILRTGTPAQELSKATIVLHVIEPDDPFPKSYQFRIPAEISGGREIFVGLTGKDWPSLDQRPVAWKAIIENRSGEVLASQQSFLWVDEDLALTRD